MNCITAQMERYPFFPRALRKANKYSIVFIVDYWLNSRYCGFFLDSLKSSVSSMFFLFMNGMTAEMELYPIFSQGFEKSRTPALHHSFVWERPTLSIFSQQQSAQNTQHRHYSEEHRYTGKGRNTTWFLHRIKVWVDMWKT